MASQPGVPQGKGLEDPMREAKLIGYVTAKDARTIPRAGFGSRDSDWGDLPFDWVEERVGLPPFLDDEKSRPVSTVVQVGASPT
jgi:hypothetical protein